MENIWDYLRGNKLSRLVWDNYEAIVAACKEAWHFLIGDKERIDSIARRSLGMGQSLGRLGMTRYSAHSLSPFSGGSGASLRDSRRGSCCTHMIRTCSTRSVSRNKPVSSVSIGS